MILRWDLSGVVVVFVDNGGIDSTNDDNNDDADDGDDDDDDSDDDSDNKYDFMIILIWHKYLFYMLR